MRFGWRLQAKARALACSPDTTANRELNDQCGNQHHSRKLLMMGIVMPETR